MKPEDITNQIILLWQLREVIFKWTNADSKMRYTRKNTAEALEQLKKEVAPWNKAELDSIISADKYNTQAIADVQDKQFELAMKILIKMLNNLGDIDVDTVMEPIEQEQSGITA